MPKKLRCTIHGGIFSPLSSRGRPPTKCADNYPCTKAETVTAYDAFDFFDTSEKPAKARSQPTETSADQGGFSLFDTLTECFEREPYAPQDKALAHLALTYADELDNDGELARLGPLLQSALESLQMSPRARAMSKKGMTTDAKPGNSKLDELRERRERKRAATANDTASS